MSLSHWDSVPMCAVVPVLARRPAAARFKKPAVTKRLHWALSLRTYCPWIAVAQLQDSRSSATPITCSWARRRKRILRAQLPWRAKILDLGDSREFSELGHSCRFSGLGDSGRSTLNATMWVCCAHFSYTFLYLKRLSRAVLWPKSGACTARQENVLQTVLSLGSMVRIKC